MGTTPEKLANFYKTTPWYPYMGFLVTDIQNMCPVTNLLSIKEYIKDLPSDPNNQHIIFYPAFNGTEDTERF